MSDDFYFGTSDLESNEELDLDAWAKNNGWESRKIQYQGRVGCPDRLIYGYGVALFIEMKRPSLKNKKGGGLRKSQELEIGRFKAAGVHVPVFYTSDEAIEYLRGFM